MAQQEMSGQQPARTRSGLGVDAGTRGGHHRRALLGSMIAAALVLAGCATTIAGTPAPLASPDVSTSLSAPSASGSGQLSAPESTDPPQSIGPQSSQGAAPTSGSTAVTSAGKQIDPTAFAAKMAVANAGIKTMRGAISVDAGPLTEQGTFSETVFGGEASAMDMTLFVRSGGQSIPLKVLIVDNKVYLGGSEMLAALKAGDKKWALASASSSNSTLRSLATQLDGLLGSASANQYKLFAEAAKTIVDGGPTQLGQVDAHKYVITVDVAELSRLMTGTARSSMQAVLASGVTTIPSTIWLDETGRVVQTRSAVRVDGVSSDTLFKLTAYNTPVVIKAPAKADVYTG